jgi:predicted alpha/beta hydrolase family esterase
VKRRLVWIIVAVLLLLGAVGYYGFFRATNEALQRAESFEFRRMQVARIEGEARYRFFFATNRVAERDDGPLKERLGAARQSGLTLGSFDTEFEPTLGLGRWLDASSWFLDEEINILDVRRLEQAELVAQVRAMVADSPHRGLLLLVHGFRTDFDFALRGTAFLASVLDINAPVMVFDWPGNQGSSLSGYRRAQQVATASAAELADTLRLIVREIRPERLWLVAHSMGAQVVVDAFSELYRDSDFADADFEVDDVVLTAPDVDRAKFREQFKAELKALARNTTVYVSSNDRALLASRLINRARRLGESSLSKEEAELLDTVEAALELVEPGSNRVSLVDVTPINRTRNFHNFSLEVPEYFDDIFLRLTNSETPENRLRYQVRMPNGKLYWVLTRGR